MTIYKVTKISTPRMKYEQEPQIEILFMQDDDDNNIRVCLCMWGLKLNSATKKGVNKT